ncbi:RHS repeat-associated core domain-containing protein [Williamwhitmania taraxaci]|uniref:RHS repeat-associated core domain-containing protein n=1 Tax=Williamwhitmania taraxaci TaxID=1640674 RepID=A0A1G6U2U6_9BACT|nr:RHS repeat-associated core domain-containing protein [Williamwhitmania taraxaci]SDD35669.1 RHS repeat-associated core domain-containing protein [Williamwhitmania taraxaci]
MATVWQAKYSLRNLYNGNISTWTNSYRENGVASVTGEQYSYDMLNRITASKYNNLAAGTATPTPKFATSYSYDLNGNILNVNRSGNLATADAPDMDKLTYSYEAKTNKLKAVKDEVGSEVYADVDIDNQTDAENYTYDAIGNMIGDKQAGVTIHWTVYGKVAEVIPAYSATKQKPYVKYTYDAAGNRIAKQVNNMPYATPTSAVEVNNPAKVATTYYLRDATGNTMAVYERYNSKVASNYTATYTQREVSLYGSDRLGTYKPDINTPLAVVPFALLTSANLPAMAPTAPAAQLLATRTVGLKEYEFKDHLGNVRAVVSDTKSGSAQTYYDALASGTYHYYPFGMAMPGLGSASGATAYRYGYNGKEKDADMKGSDATYDYGFRIYDARIAKFLSVDPLTKKYPELTPYAYCLNNPSNVIDPDGREPITLTVLAIRAVGGAAIGASMDFTIQMTLNMSLKNEDFITAFSDVDWTSVGTSALIGAVGIPGSNLTKVVKATTITTAIVGDAAFDYSTLKGHQNIFNGEKSLVSATIDVTGSVLGGEAVKGVVKWARKAANNDVMSKGFSILNKADKNALKQRQKIVNSNYVETVTDYPISIGVGAGMNGAKDVFGNEKGFSQKVNGQGQMQNQPADALRVSNTKNYSIKFKK